VNSRRTVILILAVVLGAFAGLGLWNYVRSVEGGVYDEAQPSKIWVVQEKIPKGTTAEQALAQGQIVESEIPARFRPTTAVVDPAAELGGLVAITDLPINQPIVAGNFVPPSVANSGVVDRLAQSGMATVTIYLSKQDVVANMLEPGDVVNVLAVTEQTDKITIIDNDGEISDSLAFVDEEDESTFVRNARYVYQAAEVLAIDQALSPDLGADPAVAAANAGDRGMVTLAVPPEAVQMILNIGVENIYLSLVPPTYEPRPLPELTDDGVLPGEDAERLTPYGPTGSTSFAP